MRSKFKFQQSMLPSFFATLCLTVSMSSIAANFSGIDGEKPLTKTDCSWCKTESDARNYVGEQASLGKYPMDSLIEVKWVSAAGNN